MKNIAIVEDEQGAADLLISYLDRYSKASGEQFNAVRFADPIAFLENYKATFDIVFMDIEMPNMNGMEAAEKMRRVDSRTILIFVTNMAQYAVNGYAVDALDFIVKPVTYANFALKMRRAVERLKDSDEVKMTVNTENGVICVAASQIKYIEVYNHKLVYHLTDTNLTAYGQLKKAEKLLPKNSFCRCNNCFLVNLRYVTALKGYTVVLGGEELPVSHGKRKDFMKALADYLGGHAKCTN